MADEYIKRRDVLIKLEIAYDMARLDQKLPISDLQHEVNLIKSADVQPVRRGCWELTGNPSFRKCSECGAWWSSDITDNCFTKYCPKCGARMDGDTE